MLCFIFALEEKRREGSHMQRTAEKDGDHFLWKFSGRLFLFFLMETWRRFWNIHMDFILKTFPLQTEWFTAGCITVFQHCIHCHCVTEKRAASNYNRRHICSQCFLWLMCEGCGRSFNEVQMAQIETLLTDSAWQTMTSTTDIGVLGAARWRSGRNVWWIGSMQDRISRYHHHHL